MRLSGGKAECDRMSGVRTTRTIHAMALPTMDRDMSPPACVAGSWSMGIGEKSHGEDGCRLQGDSPRDKRKETAVGNVFGGKPGSHRGRVPLLSHTWRVEPAL